EDAGGDFISLVAYVHSVDQGEAARELAARLSVPLYRLNGHSSGHRPASGATMAGGAEQTTKRYGWGQDAPPKQPNEIRRTFYPSSGIAVKVKIKRNDAEHPWSNCYRIFADGIPIGWQWKKPDHYRAIPYVSAAFDPFDLELIADEKFWPEGEKDVDMLNNIN